MLPKDKGAHKKNSNLSGFYTNPADGRCKLYILWTERQAC